MAKILTRVYQDVINHNKIHSEYYGVVGTSTNLYDVNGRKLYIGDIVTIIGAKGYPSKTIIVQDKPYNYFVMGLASVDQYDLLNSWSLTFVSSYSHLDLGVVNDITGNFYVIEGKEPRVDKESLFNKLKNGDVDLNQYKEDILKVLKP